jgi:hypothetical protein
MEKYIKEYAWHIAQVRGTVLGECITMERLMDEYIAGYFCNSVEKKMELMDIIICTKRVTYESKAQILRAILDRQKPTMKSENKKIFNELMFIAERRNMLAHYLIDVSDQAIVDFLPTRTTITLTKFENVRSPVKFERTDIEELIGKVHKITEMFIRLKDSVITDK